MGRRFHYEPADDHGLPAGEALRSTLREPGLVSCISTQATWLSVSAYLRIRQRLKVYGGERLPKEPPFVIVANHTSHMDALALGAAVPRRVRHRMFPLAAGDVFFDTPSHTAMAALTINALPMWRDNMGRHALQHLRERLERGRGVFILFPEGKRSRDGRMLPFKAGIGMLLAATSVPVYPAYISGAFEAWPPESKRPVPGRVSVRLGEAVTFGDVENRREGWKAVAAQLREAVVALSPDEM